MNPTKFVAEQMQPISCAVYDYLKASPNNGLIEIKLCVSELKRCNCFVAIREIYPKNKKHAVIGFVRLLCSD